MTHNPRLDTRPATLEDIKQFYDIDKLGPSLRAIAFYYDNKLSGIGGVRFHRGLYIAFSDMLDGVKAPPATIYRCGLAVMEMAKSMKVPIVALKDNRMPKAEKFLDAMGFKHYRTEPEGEYYVWQA